jgi:hypothetical protein
MTGTRSHRKPGPQALSAPPQIAPLTYAAMTPVPSQTFPPLNLAHSATEQIVPLTCASMTPSPSQTFIYTAFFSTGSLVTVTLPTGPLTRHGLPRFT